MSDSPGTESLLQNVGEGDVVDASGKEHLAMPDKPKSRLQLVMEHLSPEQISEAKEVFELFDK